MLCTATGMRYGEQIAHCNKLYREWITRPAAKIEKDSNALPGVCYTVPEFCSSCGSQLANLQFYIETMTVRGATVIEAIDMIGVKRLCCRINLFTPEQQFTTQLFSDNVVYLSEGSQRPHVLGGAEIFINMVKPVTGALTVPPYIEPSATFDDILGILRSQGSV